jgi:hypothetical protein
LKNEGRVKAQREKYAKGALDRVSGSDSALAKTSSAMSTTTPVSPPAIPIERTRRPYTPLAKSIEGGQESKDG